MILADTSVWIDHFRQAIPEFAQLLSNEQILIHPMIYGELCVGNIPGRKSVLGMLAKLDHIEPAGHDEVFAFIESQGLFGIGIGFIDAHLLASVRLVPGVRLWTRDRRLMMAATRLGLEANLGGREH